MQNMKELHAHDRHKNVTEHRTSGQKQTYEQHMGRLAEGIDYAEAVQQGHHTWSVWRLHPHWSPQDKYTEMVWTDEALSLPFMT